MIYSASSPCRAIFVLPQGAGVEVFSGCFYPRFYLYFFSPFFLRHPPKDLFFLLDWMLSEFPAFGRLEQVILVSRRRDFLSAFSWLLSLSLIGWYRFVFHIFIFDWNEMGLLAPLRDCFGRRPCFAFSPVGLPGSMVFRLGY